MSSSVYFARVSSAALAITIALLCGVAFAQYEGVEYVWEGNPAVRAKLEQWQDLKLGFMVHWGTYSQKGWCESWGLCSEDVDWLTPPEPDYQTYYDTYVGLKNTFSPREFDPAEWARMAREAGMRYLVFTTKHHDGFCMFDTRETDYKITDEGCPFHDHRYADVTKHLFDAFRREGFMIGAYFSKPDWHVPWYWSPHWQHGTRNVNYRPKAHPEIWEKFCEFTHAQVEELCTGYGPVDILWLDGAWVDPTNRDQDIRMDRIAATARRHQPGMIIVDRWVGGPYENYRTPEQRVPDEPWEYPWETCMSMAGAWSYNADDTYKPTRQLVQTLVDVVAKGGNLLLNAGADGNGRFHPDAVARLRELGEWLSINGEAIYGTRPVPPYKEGKVCYTRRRDDGAVYAVYLPDEGETLPLTLLLDEVQAEPGEEVRLLGHPDQLRWEAVDRGMWIEIPESAVASPPCEHAWVFRLGRVREIEPPLSVSDLDGWQIAVPREPPPAVAYAARELGRLLSESAGLVLPIASTRPGDSASIATDRAAVADAEDGDRVIRLAVDPALPEEGLRIGIGDSAIRIAGCSPRGVLYGVYEFAERYLGVRFLTADHTYYPPDAGSRTLPRETHAMTPVFDFRWPYLGETNLHPEFAARLRVNTVAEADSLGGMTGQRLISHSLGEQLPVAEYGDEHPEYFALARGERCLEAFGGGPQPCLTNPDVLDIVTAAVMDEIAAHPERRNVSVSQTDNDLYCRCAACEAINQSEGSPMGTQLSFVNAVAERVAARYPDMQVGTLAYWHTRKPPAHLRPGPNVQIELANIECCCLHSLVDTTCARNASFLADLREWCRIADQVYVWSYFTDFRYYDLPFPNLRSIGPNLRLFADLGVKGVFAQSHGGSTSGDMSDLRNYVIARLLRNPYLDGWALVEGFCRLHYGAAGEEILAYLSRLHDRAESLGIHPTCFATPEELGLDADFAAEMMERFARARAIAEREGPEYVARVEKASLTAHRAMLEAGAPLGYVNGAVRRTYPHPYDNIVDEYLRLAATYGLDMPDERTSMADFAERLRRDAATGRPAELLENDVWRLVFLPGENGRLVEMTLKPTGRDYLRAYRNNLRFGTFEEWESLLFDENADLAPFAVERMPDGLVLRKEDPDGPVHMRRIKLAGETIRCVTRIENHGTESVDWQLVVHPEWNAGSDTDDYRELTASVRIGDKWRPFNRGMQADRGPDVDLLSEGLSGRAMGFYNHVEKYGLLMRYSPENIKKLRTWWVHGYRQINLELETERVTLAPGESFEISYSFEPWDGVSD
jgi:alpha-L-fucosidase